jgi:hypothetical protein
MAYKDDVNLPQFPSDLSCEAAMIDAATLKNWSSRKPPAVFVARNERVKVGDRSFFKFSFRRVMQLAITAELVQFNIPPREAAWMAAEFSDSENSTSPRGAGELFAKNYTLLFVVGTEAALINVPRSTPWFALSSFSPWQKPAAQIVLNINEIDGRVRMVLGIPVHDREFD